MPAARHNEMGLSAGCYAEKRHQVSQHEKWIRFGLWLSSQGNATKRPMECSGVDVADRVFYFVNGLVDDAPSK
jgi:hypothetical protein